MDSPAETGTTEKTGMTKRTGRLRPSGFGMIKSV